MSQAILSDRNQLPRSVLGELTVALPVLPSADVCVPCRMANQPAYEFVLQVTAKDTYEGLQMASDLFVSGTLQK